MVFPLMQQKTTLIDLAFQNPKRSSFADLGGVWGVEGGYTFYAVEHNPQITHAYLYDNEMTEFVKFKVDGYPQVHLQDADFHLLKTAVDGPKVDVIFMFYVLNHQVNPNWDDVLRAWAKKTDCFLIYSPQWFGSETTVRLLDLGKEKYFASIPKVLESPVYKDLFTEKHDLVKDKHNIWQWGLNNLDLRKVMAELDFHETYVAKGGKWEGIPFEDYGFIFERNE